ncbi:recombinase family protein, partial [Streptomyces sp. NPDC051016]
NNIELQIIDMNINTKDAMGKMFFTMMSAFAELEANLLSERTKKGLASARARGRVGGRPPMPDHKKREIKFLYDEQKMTGEQIAEATGVSRSTVYRVVKN